MRGCVPTCLRASIVYVPTCLRHKRPNFSILCASVLINVLTCHNVCQCFKLKRQCAKRHANFPTWCAKMSKGVRIFQTFLLQNAKGNFYTLLLYKKFYIMFDIIVIHVCICILHKNCIILYFYTSCHIKKSVWNFFFLNLVSSLVRNEKTWFLVRKTLLQVTRVPSNFPELKQLNKIKNTYDHGLPVRYNSRPV